MHWKVQLQGQESTLTQLAQAHNSPGSQITRDGVDWFLESTDFDYSTDHLEVKEKATVIVNSILASGTITPGSANIEVGAIYRIHYDNSKTVFR